MRRIILLILILAMMPAAGFSRVCAAADVELSKADKSKISLLYKMGIIDSEDIKTDTISRGEFAVILARLVGWEEYPAVDNGFTDVPADSEYASAVSAVYAMGSMVGISKTEFGINEKISLQNAAVSLVRLLGYEGVARGKGGYPEGHNSVAGSLGLYKGIGMEKNSERASILLMCYNSLTARYIDSEGEISEINTLLEKAHNVYKVKGVVTANRFTMLGTSGGAMASNEIAIDKQAYYTDDVSLADYIGEYVTGYYFAADGERYIICLEPDEKKNNKLVIEAKDIISADGDMLRYENEDDITKNIYTATGFDFIINNKLVNNRTIADLMIDDGELIFIDNNNDRKYDVVKAKRRETMVYQGADNLEDRIYCKEDMIYTNPFDDTYYCEIKKVDEKTGAQTEISIDEISRGDVLTVYRSEDSKFLQIYVYSSYLKGYIEEITDEEVIIDGTAYDLPLKTPADELRLGTKTSFSLDMFGRLVYMDDSESEAGPHYAYFFRYFEDEEDDFRGKMKLLIGNDAIFLSVADEVRIDESIKYDSVSIKSSVLFNDGKPVRQLIKYKLNSKGEIRDIYTVGGPSPSSIKKANEISSAAETNYYQWHQIWAGKYIQPEDCFFLVCPTVGDEPSDSELYSTEYEYGSDVNSCHVEIFDINENMEAGAILLYAQDPLQGIGKTNQNTKVGVVVKKSLGEDGDIITLFSNGKKTEYYVNEVNLPSLADYAPGDVVRYIVGKDGRISTLFTVMDIGTSPADTPVPTLSKDGYCDHYFARVKDKLDDYLILIPNENNPDFTDTIANRVTVPTAAIRNCTLVDMSGPYVNVYEGSIDSVAKYYGGDSSGVPCYVYTRVYKFDTLFDLVIYKF